MPVVPLKGGEPVHSPVRGRWYRCGWYGANKKSHRVHDRDTSIFWCGRIVWPEPDLMDAAGIAEWLMYEEERKATNVRCGDCAEKSSRFDEGAALRQRRIEQLRGQHLYDRVVTFDDLYEMAAENASVARAAEALGI